jgi:hypothetical protein
MFFKGFVLISYLTCSIGAGGTLFVMSVFGAGNAGGNSIIGIETLVVDKKIVGALLTAPVWMAFIAVRNSFTAVVAYIFLTK